LDTGKPVIEVMAGYESFPLRQRDPSGATNVDPAALPISPELAQDAAQPRPGRTRCLAQ
jgi:hypothetical protein